MWRTATKIIEESDCRHFAINALIFFMYLLPSPRFSAARAVDGRHKHRPQCHFERPVHRHPVHRPRQCRTRSTREEFVSVRQTSWHRRSQQEPESQGAQGTDAALAEPTGLSCQRFEHLPVPKRGRQPGSRLRRGAKPAVQYRVRLRAHATADRRYPMTSARRPS